MKGNASKMTSKASAKELVPFVQHRAGDLVRSVVYFDQNARTVLYARDDITDHHSEDEIDVIFNDLSFDALGKTHTEQVYPHGALNCIVRCFDGAIELHFPHGEESGSAIALEPNAVTDLEGLINDCLDVLYTEDASALAESSGL